MADIHRQLINAIEKLAHGTSCQNGVYELRNIYKCILKIRARYSESYKLPKSDEFNETHDPFVELALIYNTCK